MGKPLFVRDRSMKKVFLKNFEKVLQVVSHCCHTKKYNFMVHPTYVKVAVFQLYVQFSFCPLCGGKAFSDENMKSWLSCYKKAIWGTWRIHSFIQKNWFSNNYLGSGKKGTDTFDKTTQLRRRWDAIRVRESYMHSKKGWREKEQLNFISLNLVISKYLFANYL